MELNNGKKIFVILLSFFLLFFVINDLNATKEQMKIDKIIKSGKIVAGTSADYPPYEFRAINDDDTIYGMDIDIANEIAKDLGVKLEIKEIVFSRLFDAVRKGEIDFIIAGLSPTEKRKKIVDFSVPYYKALQNMLIRSADVNKINSLEDLRGKKVGTQKGSIQEELVKQQIAGALFFEEDTIIKLVDDLKKGKLDVIILEKPVAESFAKRNKGLINIKCVSESSFLGSAIAVKKGDKKLLKRINMILAKLKHNNMIIEFAENAKLLMEGKKKF